MKTVWLIIISSLITSMVAGSGTYYYTNKKTTKEKGVLQEEITNLNTTISNTKKLIIENQSATDQQSSTTDNPSDITNPDTPVSSEPITLSTPTNTQTACDTVLSVNSLKEAYFVTESTKISENTYKLSNGKYQKDPFILTLLTDFVACDKSTNNDVATIAKYNVGGTGYFYILETFGPKNNTPIMTAMTYLGDRVKVKSLTMSNGLITVNMITQGPNDSAAEPTLNVTNTYKLPTSGIELIKQ